MVHHRSMWILILYFASLSVASTPYYEDEDICSFSMCACMKTMTNISTVTNVDCKFRRIQYLMLERRASLTHHKHIKRHYDVRPTSYSIEFDGRYNYLSTIGEEFHLISPNTARLIKKLLLSYNRLKRVNADSFATLRNLQTLSLDHNQLHSIPDLHELLSLKELDLSYNNAITELPGAILPNSLQKLAIAGVGIKRITSSSLNGLSALQFLDMSDGIGTGLRKRNIYTDAFDGLGSLTRLDISYTPWSNNITNANLWQHLTNLSCLKAQRCYLKKPLILYNQSANVPFSKNLTELDVSGNRFDASNLTTVRFPKLERFYLNNTWLANLPQNAFQTMPNLTDLHVSGVGLGYKTDVNFEALSSLRYLDLSFNKLSVSPVLPSQVEQVNFLGNKIRTITRRAFSNLRHIKTLNLGDQGISNIEEMAFYNPNLTETHQLLHLNLQNNELTSITDSSLLGLNSLVILNLRGNHIASIATTLPLPSVEELDLSDNDLISISTRAFSNMSSLTSLDLSQNYKLNDLHFETTMEQLAILNLNDCNMTFVPNLSNLPLLRTLKLSNNFIEHIAATDFDNCCQNLRTLILDRNIIEIAPVPIFAHLVNLEYLDLSENSPIISNVAFQNLDNLVTLKLKHNDLDTFLEYPLPKLEELDMGQNNLTDLGAMQLRELFPRIRKLDLNSNIISLIKGGLLDGMEHLTFVDFKYNEFKCPCNESSEEFQTYLYVKDWLKAFANSEQSDSKMDISPNTLSLFTYFCIRHGKEDVVNLFEEFTCEQDDWSDPFLNMSGFPFYNSYDY